MFLRARVGATERVNHRSRRLL